jgi:bis(5'-nucleosidyl)-tetraphosphatase
VLKARQLSAGVVVVRRPAQGCGYLLLRAYNYWDFPKGLVEAGEDPLATARREVREETGLRRLAFRWGEGYLETAPYGRGKVARYYVAETDEERVVLSSSPELGRPEHHEYRWVSAEEAGSLLVPRVQAVLDWAVRLTGCGAPTR